MTIQEIEAMVEIDLPVNMSDLAGESIGNPVLHSKYIKMINREKVELRDYEYSLVKLYREKYLFYSGKGIEAFDIVLDTASEIKVCVEGDDEIREIKRKITHRKNRIKFLEDTCDEFRNRGFAIKNAMDIIKFNAGER